MTQPKKITPLTLDSNPSIAVAKAALAVCEGSSIPGELYDRLGMVSDAINHLEHIACAADFHSIDLSFRDLYGVMRLVNREVKAIESLFTALREHGED